MEDEWSDALPRLRQLVGERNFATWIEPIRCSRDPEGLRLEVASTFFQAWVSRHFLGAIRAALGEGGTARSVRVVVVPGTSPERHAAPPPRQASAPRRPKIGHLVADYTFASFVVGHANEVAYRAARSVGEFPGRRFNPFFLWGGVGLGKTHLINALAHDLLARQRQHRVACLSAETFMNTMITSLRHDQMATFRDRFREVDVLILDDVQFLAGKERTQEEFFHTFNALHTTGRQVVLTSDNPPHAIVELEQRLRSRFEGGLTVNIHPPTEAMRVAIVVKKAGLQGVELPQAVAHLVARRSGPSVRELEGALTRVLAAVVLRGAPLDADTVQHVLGPAVPLRPAVSVEIVQETVSQHFHLSVADLKSHRRGRSLAFPRQVAMYLSRTWADASFLSIGEKFGGRDHSTVMYAVRAMEEKRNQDPNMVSLLNTLENELRQGSSP
jgi:chromosomal replication initiator protein